MPSPGSSQREPAVGQPVGQTNPAGPGTENSVHQSTSGANENSSTIRQSGVRVLPLRTVVAAVPATGGHAPTSHGSMGLVYPVLARIHRSHSGNLNSNGGQSSNGPPPRGADTSRQSTPGATHQRINVPGDGNFESLCYLCLICLLLLLVITTTIFCLS